MIHQKI